MSHVEAPDIQLNNDFVYLCGITGFYWVGTEQTGKY